MDETWTRLHEPNLKCQSNEWKHPSSPRPKKVHPTQNAVKEMFIVAYDIDEFTRRRDVNPVDWPPNSPDMNPIQNLWAAVKRILRSNWAEQPPIRTPEELWDRVLDAWEEMVKNLDLFHNLMNSMPHRMRAVVDAARIWLRVTFISSCTSRSSSVVNILMATTPKISSRNLAGNKLTIPYSPDLAPGDFHLFLHLKKFLGGQRFDDDDEVKTAVQEWFASQAGEFYNEGVERLVPRLDKCLNNGGDYVEK
ncbi:hypothetical protein ANN_06069 [Periplaneta americana]|uniref:Tc1-like transposase DDE domain-containing protein n=1 Tax=Periplaneta americana TaxID=6978 RepID=A0ABQ8TED9_PERAM|nr:hypothetical protein ANN_06069 [Periplaneta americana]